jgi:hypothetical protein
VCMPSAARDWCSVTRGTKTVVAACRSRSVIFSDPDHFIGWRKQLIGINKNGDRNHRKLLIGMDEIPQSSLLTLSIG